MNIVDSLINYLRSNKSPEKGAPEGLCPNCWGQQEYGGNFYEAVKTHGLDINKKDHDIGWIRDYAERHLNGIRLHEHGKDEYVCEQCKLSLRKVD